MAPWAKAYTVDMKDMYTELALEKIENKPTGPIHSDISNYKNLFKENQDDAKYQSKEGKKPSVGIKMSKKAKVERQRSESDRVLLKAEPGFGKTTFSRKISWDLAMGLFTTFSIVFFVSLKLVKPGDVIENIIIQQTPVLEGMNVTQNKLSKILDTFGHRCLLILDGFDELQSKSKLEIVKIIKAQKLFCCHVFLTSRPHIVADIENHFETTVMLKGFTAEHAHMLIDKILADKKQRREVRKFTRKHRFLHESLHTCPILLLFICILAQNNKLDTFGRNVTSDIYLKLIRSLYIKYCVRKDREFKQCDFRDVLQKVGKLAFHCLLSKNYLFERKEVLSAVGEDAFEYDFLIGHKDFRLLGDETADIFVSFNHFTLQEFLGSFHLLSVMNKGVTIENLLGSERTTAPFLISGLFLHFCLSMLNNAASLLNLKEDNCVYQNIKLFILKLINVHQLDLGGISDTFPSLTFPNAVRMRDKLVMEFLRDIFSSCQNARCLLMGNEDLDPFIIDSLAPIVPRLSEIYCFGDRYRVGGFTMDIDPEPDIFPQMLNIFISQSNREVLQSCLRYSKRRISVCVFLLELESHFNLSPFLDERIERLHVLNISRSVCKIFCYPLTKRCPLLTHLYLRGLWVQKSVLTALSMAALDNKLPVLTRLDLPMCHFVETDSILQMFQCLQRTLTHLSLRNCFLSKDGLDIITGHKTLLPEVPSLELPFGPLSHKLVTWEYCKNLKELRVSFESNEKKNDCDKMEVNFLKQMNSINLCRLTSLILHRCICSTKHLYLMTNGKFLAQLGKLDISHSVGITGSLSILLSHKFTSLETLTLYDCGLNSHVALNLAKANTDGRLSSLKHLDLSQNYLVAKSHSTDHYQSIFSFNCKWEHLECLALAEVTPADDAFDFMISSHEEGFLKSLQTLVISLNPIRFESKYRYRIWHNLSKLDIHSSHSNYSCVLDCVADAVEIGVFPNLRNVCSHIIFPEDKIHPEQNENILFTQLRQHNLPLDLCRQVIDVVPRVTSNFITHTFLHTNPVTIPSFETVINSQIDSVIKGLAGHTTPAQKEAIHNVLKGRFYWAGNSREIKSEILEMAKVLTPLLQIVKQRLRDKNISVFLFSTTVKKGEAYQPEARTKLVELNGFCLQKCTIVTSP